LEKQSTNVLSYSNTSDWGLSPSITKTQNTTDLLSPDGTNNATKMVASAGTGDTSNTLSIADGAITFSFWGRVASGTKTLAVDLRNNSGTVISSSPVLTTEWQRFTLTNSTSGTGSSGAAWIFPNGAGTFYIWGAQAEVGSYATSTILTNGSSATRVADACFKTGISSLIGQTEGTIFYDGYVGNEITEVYTFLQESLGSGVDSSMYLQCLLGEVAFQGYNSSTVQQWNIRSAPYTIGQRIKIAGAYKANDIVLYVNGTQIGTDTSATIPTCTALQLGTYPELPNPEYTISKPINQAALFKTRLTNAELASLTTI
jgi:hypothetical protein